MRNLNNFEYLTRKFKNISGINTGIVRNFSVYSRGIKGDRGLNVVTGSMPEYTKLTISPSHDMSYHISGYGNTIEEAYIRFLGESVERYASIISHEYLKDYIIKGSKRELESKYELITPPDMFNVLSHDQLIEMNKMNSIYRVKPFSSDDRIHWVVTNSLLNSNEKVLTPASTFFVGFTCDQLSMPSFTTGCACHENIYKAAINGLIEYIQIDAFMLYWYTNTTRKCIPFESLPDDLKNALKKSLGDLIDNYDVLIVDYSNKAKVNIPIVGVFIIAKDPKKSFPAISFGVQAGLDVDNTIYRGTQEALAVLEMSKFTPFNSSDILTKARDKNNRFFDLDSNVAYFSLPQYYKKNKEYINRYIDGNISYDLFKNKFKEHTSSKYKHNLTWLIKEISTFSKYASYLDITPPNILDPTLRVMRTFIPELMHMSFPGYPYLLHNRYKEEEDVKPSYYPHPLP